jgi:nicotinate-nucleotide pyrophosphorylase (carboxylating)
MSKSNLPLPLFPQRALKALLLLAFEEDEGRGDVTSLATLSETHASTAALIAKEDGIFAGLPILGEVFRHRGLAPRLETRVIEGNAFKSGEVLARIEGTTRDLLVCERILLNLLQRLCGIATETNRFVSALAGSKTKILDTRKTPPGYRELDKYAVAVGGGTNHRHGLYDQILIKDNHADACGGVREAVKRARTRFGGAYTVECEVRTLEELDSLVGEAVDIVLLDNMDDATLVKAIALARQKMPRVKLEGSGNMNLQRVTRLKTFGLDFISVGALTHSVKALDLSLKIIART